MSVTQLNEEDNPNSTMNQSTSSLSKSLGAKVFSEEKFQISDLDTSTKDITDEGDEFVDATESQSDQSAVTTSMKSIDQHQNRGYSNSEFCDKMYVVSGVSIKYDRLPCNTTYTR